MTRGLADYVHRTVQLENILFVASLTMETFGLVDINVFVVRQVGMDKSDGDITLRRAEVHFFRKNYDHANS